MSGGPIPESVQPMNVHRHARRARARALQEALINAWILRMSLRKAMSTTGISWHQIQAWRRWDRDFRDVFDGTKELVEIVRKEDREIRLWEKALYGNSDRALDLFCRLFMSKRLCPRCRNRMPESQ